MKHLLNVIRLSSSKSENKTGSYAWFPTEKELEAGKAELAPQPVLF